MSKITRKIFSVVTGLMVMAWLIGPGIAYGETTADLQAQIDALLAQLAGLQSQLTGLEGTTPATGEVPTACEDISFDRNLKQGMSGTDVKCLQALLNTDPDTQVASSGAGSPGNETTYFGSRTKAAVVKFQELYADEILEPLGLTKGTGFVGSATRAKLNELLEAGVVVPPEEEVPVTPVTGEYKAMLADDNPAAGTLADGSAYNTMLKVKVEAGAEKKSITSVTIERFGLSVDTNVSGVLVVDAADKRHGNVVTFADNKTTIDFASDPIEIAAGQSTTIAVQYHIAAAAQSGTIGAKITKLTGDPTGLPLSSNLFSIADGANTLGSLTVDVVSLTTATVNVDIGQTDYYLTKFRFVAGANEDIKISKLILFQNGTSADEDLKNWELVDPAGNVLASVEKAVSKVITFDLSASPYTIAKGTQKDLQVRLDVVSGSVRTAQVIIQNDYDAVVKGVSTGAGILPTAAAVVDPSFPIGDRTDTQTGYNHMTIAAGTLTVNKSATSPSGTIGIGAASVTLAIFELEAKGEDIQIQRADFEIGGASIAGDFAGTIKLMTDAGQTLYSVAPATATGAFDDDAAAGGDQVTFSTYYTISASTVLKLKLVVDTSTNMTGTDTAIGRLGAIYYKRMTSNTYNTASATTWISGNTLTASAAALTAVKNAAYGDTTIIAGQSNAKIASYLLQTGSAEGVNVSSINLDITRSDHTTALSAAQLAALSNLKLKRADTGAQIGSTVASPAATNTVTVSGQLNIPANTTIQIDAYVNFATSGYAADYGTDIDASDVSGTGAVSGSTANAPAAAITGQAIAVTASGTLTVSMETSGAASSQFYTAGLTGVEMARVKLAATVEDMKIQKLTLRTINGTGNLANAKLLGTGLASDPSVPLTAGQAIFSFSSGSEITVPAYGSKVLTVQVDTTEVGTLIADNFGIIGFATADAIGSGSGLTTQERLTGTAYVAGTDNYAGQWEVVYFTQTATDSTDVGTAVNTAPGFYLVTAVTNANLTTATGSLFLNDDADDVYWAASDIITKLTKVESVAGDGNAGVAYNVGDIIYVFDTDDNEAGFAIVTTGVDTGDAVSGLVFSPAGNIALGANDRVVKLTNARALVGNTMRYEEVEPVIALASSSPSGSVSPSSSQTIAIFNITASGYRDMTFDSLTIEKSGSNSPEQYVTDFSVWQGSTRLARVANSTVAGTSDDANSNGVNADTTFNICTGNTSGAVDEIGNITTPESATIAIGDKLTIVASGGADTDTSTVTVTDIDNALAACDGNGATGRIITADGNVTWDADDTTLTIRNFRVHLDANQAGTGDVALASQTITAGQTMILTVKADTSSVRTGVTTGTVTFGVSIPGVAGPLQVAMVDAPTTDTDQNQVEGLNWYYTSLYSGAVVTARTEGDSYPVSGNTLVY